MLAARACILLLAVGITARAEPPAESPPPLRLHGSVEPVRSHAIVVPRLSGSGPGSLVILRLVKPGAAVKRGDVLIEFDRQAQIKTAHDRAAEYRDFVEQINRKRGEQLTLRAHDEAELKTADNSVKSADLEMLKNEMAPAITAEQNRLSLDEARARLQQLRRTFDLKRRAAAADLRALEIQRDRARTPGAMPSETSSGCASSRQSTAWWC